MDSNRLYYHDAYTTQFSAQIVEQVTADGRTALILDQTHFYPTSGGQPFDTGKINDVPVVDVTIRESDGAILHWVEQPLPASGEATAVLDWSRRFDHMQQHTGQHILSQAFLQTAAAATVSFHLSDETVTIDLDKPDLTESEITAAEQLANEIIWQNRPIHIRFVTPEESEQLLLRKRPPAHNGRLRLIEIADFDLCACGGTHVRHTGEVGQIKVVRRERRGEGWRIEFRCGRRALADYGRKNQIITVLAELLTTAPDEFAAAIQKLQADNKQSRRQLRKLQTAALAWEAQELLKTAQPLGDVKLIIQVFDDGRDPGQLRQLGNHLVQHPGVIAFLGLAGDKTHMVFCRHAKAPSDMGKLLREALAELNGRGGGAPDFAQGGAPAATEKQIRRILQKTVQTIQKL